MLEALPWSWEYVLVYSRMMGMPSSLPAVPGQTGSRERRCGTQEVKLLDVYIEIVGVLKKITL